jgi:hypothetical protein
MSSSEHDFGRLLIRFVIRSSIVNEKAAVSVPRDVTDGRRLAAANRGRRAPSRGVSDDAVGDRAYRGTPAQRRNSASVR